MVKKLSQNFTGNLKNKNYKKYKKIRILQIEKNKKTTQEGDNEKK